MTTPRYIVQYKRTIMIFSKFHFFIQQITVIKTNNITIFNKEKEHTVSPKGLNG